MVVFAILMLEVLSMLHEASLKITKSVFLRQVIHSLSWNTRVIQQTVYKTDVLNNDEEIYILRT